MRILSYKETDAATIGQLHKRLPPHHPLQHREFVEHYYGASRWCKLHLLLDDTDQVMGTLGVESMPFQTADGSQLCLGFGSNYRSFLPGAGGFLLLHWLRSCDHPLVFGGSEDAHRIYRAQNWTYLFVTQYSLNCAFGMSPADSLWKQAAKWIRTRLPLNKTIAPRAERILRSADTNVSAQEETQYTTDLLPTGACFDLRFAPTTEYLDWRYGLQLEHVKYRLFRIVADTDSVGYVIVNQQRHRVIVAQADAEDPCLLVLGILAALQAVSRTSRRRKQGVVMTAAHCQMHELLIGLGFRTRTRPLVLGGWNKPPDPAGFHRWLVNYDWGDNGLQPPFLNRAA